SRPTVWKSPASGGKPCRRGIAPIEDRRPMQPQWLAGRRVEPPASVPSASGATPAIKALAAPPLDPPGDRSGAQGLPVDPKTRLLVCPASASSGVLVLPNMTAPAARSLATG